MVRANYQHTMESQTRLLLAEIVTLEVRTKVQQQGLHE